MKYTPAGTFGLKFMECKTIEDLFSAYANNQNAFDVKGNIIKTHMKEFFNRADVKSYVDQNQWYHVFNVFKIWKDSKGWSFNPLVLAHFLYLLDIDPFKDWDPIDISDIFGSAGARNYFE